MQSKEVLLEGNNLQLTLASTSVIQNQPNNHYDSYSNISDTPTIFERSAEFVISGVVTIQIKNDIYRSRSSKINQVISIDYNKRYQSDTLIYNVKLSSKTLKIKKYKFLISECDNHCIQIKESIGFIREFDIRFVLDIFSDCTLFAPLYEDTDFTDFEIHGESGSVNVHKSVLLSHSPVFKVMLSGPWKEAKTGVLEVPKITKEHLQQLKDYMYLKKMPNSAVEHLAALASYLMMPDLKKRCAVKLLGILSAENATELLEFAVKHNIKLLMLGILDSVQRGSIKITDIDRCCIDE